MNLTRRGFLVGTGAGFALYPLRSVAGPLPEPPSWSPNPFILISAAGPIAIWCHRSEMGQGVRSSLPVLIADALGADPARVEIIQADGDEKYGDQDTDGSSSVRMAFIRLREAAATARTMLIAAAAKRWRVPAGKLAAHAGSVWNGTTSLTFGALVEEARRQPVPKKVTLRA